MVPEFTAIPFVDHDDRADRQVIARRAPARPGENGGAALLVLDRDPGPRIQIARLHDYAADLARDLIPLLLHGHRVDDVAELDRPGHLGEDRDVEGVPLGKNLVRLDLLSILCLEDRTVDDRVPFDLPPAFPENGDLTVPVHGDEAPLHVLDRLQVLEAHGAAVSGLHRGLLHALARGPADVEGPHGQLGARLADRLGRDDPDRLPDVHLMPVGEVSTVALLADAPSGMAGQNGADPEPLEPGHLQLLDLLFVDLLVRMEQELVRDRIIDILQRDPAEDPFPHPLDDLPTLYEGGDPDPVDRTAIFLSDDHVLGHVDQAPGQVTGVGRLESRVRKTLPGPVRGDEVLEDREAFPEVRGDRGLDDLPRRFGHQPPHACELPHLVLAASGAGIRHHVDGVEARRLHHVPGIPLTSSTPISSIISEATVSVQCAQMSTTLLYFSPSVMRPLLYWSSMRLTSFSALSTISAFLEGILMSFMEMEIPESVAYL